MNRVIGIDIGSTASAIVLTDSNANVLKSSYRFHVGQITDTLNEQLKEFDLSGGVWFSCTASTPSIVNPHMRSDNRVSYIRAARHFFAKPEALLIIGGEKFGLIHFGPDGEYLNYRSNTSCAAGTGSFLDQQVGRLNMESISELGRLAASNRGEFPKIASRCSVFAKTDLIHAQQEGYSLAGICDGLCFGLSKNVIDAVFDEKEIRNLIVAGGVSLNQGVIRHVRKLTGAGIHISKYSHLYGAIGSALLFLDENRSGFPATMELSKIINSEKKTKIYTNPPLKLELSDYPDFSASEEYHFRPRRHRNMGHVEVSLYREPEPGGESLVFLGIDIGSTSTKAVLTDTQKRVVAGLYTRTSARPLAAVQNLFECIDEISKKKDHRFIIKGAGTTGSGRKFIGRIINADVIPDEITAHARAAYELNPETDTIIEIGGQDSKFTVMRNGIVTLSVMNNVCAAGTGSFIEEQARKLDCPLSEYAERAGRAESPMASDRCTVFMERDLNHFLNEGYDKDELLASVLHSIRENYLTKVAIPANIGDKIFFQGATAKNRALVAAFEQKLGKPIMVSPYCHLTGALGVALELHDSPPAFSRFRGIKLWKMEIPVRSEVCELCTNHCKLKIAEIGEETEAYGFLCGRDYNTEKFVAHDRNLFDLQKEYKRHFRFNPSTKQSEIKIGIPRILHLSEDYLLWEKFFDLLGIATVSAVDYKTAVKDGKKTADAEFCAPVAAAFGQVHYLADKADYIFLPVYLELGRKADRSKQYCFYTQFISSMLASTSKFRDNNRLLTPLVKSLQSESHIFPELREMLLSIGKKDVYINEIRDAYLTAESYCKGIQESWRKLYNEKTDREKPEILLLGRPYTVLSPDMNNKIPEIIRKNGYNAFYMDMLDVDSTQREGNSKLVNTITWKYASQIIAATEKVVEIPNLYPVMITSFKCTPDSFALEYFKEIMDLHKKPYLVLQLDEHDSAVGYETRIEAAIRSFRNHFAASVKKDEYRANPKVISYARLQENWFGRNEYNNWEMMTDHQLDENDVGGMLEGRDCDFDLSDIKTGETRKLEGKIILIPGWDMYASRLIEAVFRAEGREAYVIADSEGSIRRSLNLNTGQCLPLNIIAQNALELISEMKLDPASVAIWVPRGFLACNLTMFPHFIKKIMKKHDPSMGAVSVYPGNIGFYDFSVRTGMNVFLAYYFAGNLRKTSCSIRPYEKNRGETERIMEKSFEMLYKAFLFKENKEEVLKDMMQMLDGIGTERTIKPKVAIFGDMYARDNDVFNKDLVRIIEENGGEALVTSYSEYIKIILKQTEQRYLLEGRYMEHYSLRFLKYLIPMLEKRYDRFFDKYVDNLKPRNNEMTDILRNYRLELLHRGETVDNILKIENLVKHYDGISLFVQTNPAYCCPSLVTEAMSAKIEKMTGIPVVSIEYDGTGGNRNEDIIPYLKLRGGNLSLK